MSSPASGSVTAKQALSVPATSGGSMRCFCSALPNTTTGLSPKMFMCSAEAPDIPAPDCAIVCIISAASVTPRPEPPYCSGNADAEPAGVRERTMEVVREAALAVLGEPIVGVEFLAHALDRAADRLLFGGEREIHVN